MWLRMKNFSRAGGRRQVIKAVVLLALCLTLLSGCIHPVSDPLTAEEHRLRAEQLIIGRDFAAAAAELELALRKNAGDGDLHLRHGEILEAAGRPLEALTAYERAQRFLNRDDPRQQELTYRLALLEAGELDRAEQAEKRLAELPEGSIPRLDLQGVIALGKGEARQALLLYNQALQQGPAKDMAARILYHASLAYHRLGDVKNAYGMLYRAVNLADNEALLKEIELFFKQLNASNPSH